MMSHSKSDNGFILGGSLENSEINKNKKQEKKVVSTRKVINKIKSPDLNKAS